MLQWKSCSVPSSINHSQTHSWHLFIIHNLNIHLFLLLPSFFPYGLMLSTLYCFIFIFNCFYQWFCDSNVFFLLNILESLPNSNNLKKKKTNHLDRIFVRTLLAFFNFFVNKTQLLIVLSFRLLRRGIKWAYGLRPNPDKIVYEYLCMYVK